LGGLDTSSNELDALYGYEGTSAEILAYLSGADEIYSIGLLGNAQILSLDKMVFDNHLARQIEVMARPVLVDEEHLQVDLIERVGIGGTYLTQRETRDFARSEYVPMWPPAGTLAPRCGCSAGETAMEVVHEEALDILHNHQPPPLPEGAADKIEAIVAEADKALA
jgi:trimethylamine--corrinoid protein Co-methyltransferase